MTKTITTKGITLQVRVEGQGTPLLFLGGSSFDLALGNQVFESALPTHFTVAAADHRGLGLTQAPTGQWSMRDYAQDAVHLIDALGWQQVHVLGESFGAMIALELALLAPERLVSMALAAGAPGGAGGSSYPIHEFLKITNPKERASISLGIQDTRFQQLLLDNPVQAELMITERVQREQAFLAHANNQAGYPRLLAARAEHDCWNRLQHIQTETIIIAGEYDNQAPMSRAKAMAGALSQATLLRFDAGHGVCFADTQAVTSLLALWTQN